MELAGRLLRLCSLLDANELLSPLPLALSGMLGRK